MEIFETIMGWFDFVPAWIAAITGVVTAATAITALTPTRADDDVLDAVLRVLNILAGNINHNKNADDVPRVRFSARNDDASDTLT